MGIEDCSIITLEKKSDPRGNLTFIEGAGGRRHVPFDIKRVYYLYDVPAGETRAGHAHRKLEQLMIAVSGSFDVELDDGAEKKTFRLHLPYEGLYICSMIWREIKNFSSGSVCMVLASDYYDEADYYREHEDFLAAVRAKR